MLKPYGTIGQWSYFNNNLTELEKIRNLESLANTYTGFQETSKKEIKFY
jgi:hypothetical protein